MRTTRPALLLCSSILTPLHSGQRGVDNLAKPLKENIIEGLIVLVSKIAVIMMKNNFNLSIIKVNDTPSPRVTRILVPEKHRVMRKPC